MIQREIFAIAVLRLCLYHLLTQEKEDLWKTGFDGTGEDLEILFDYFWRLAETETRDEAEQLWTELEKWLQKLPKCKENFKAEARLLVAALKLKERKWVGAFFHQKFTLGMRTQGRVESRHAMMKRRGTGLSRRSRFLTALMILSVQTLVREERLCAAAQDGDARSVPPTNDPILHLVARYLTPHGYQLFREQYELSSNYSCQWIRGADGSAQLHVRLKESSVQRQRHPLLLISTVCECAL